MLHQLKDTRRELNIYFVIFVEQLTWVYYILVVALSPIEAEYINLTEAIRRPFA